MIVAIKELILKKLETRLTMAIMCCLPSMLNVNLNCMSDQTLSISYFQLRLIRRCTVCVCKFMSTCALVADTITL